MTSSDTRLILGGSPVDLREFDEAIGFMADRARSTQHPPLAVASINLDHIHHFGTGSRWSGTIAAVTPAPPENDAGHVEWLNLIDGAPLASQAERLTGRAWPRLAGSDLIGPLLARAERDGTSIGFLGGAESTHLALGTQLATMYPRLRVAGFWAPERSELSDPLRSRAIAQEIAAAQTEMLIVGLGKPRQELWIAQYGLDTGARVLLAFGAVVDFLAGRVSRAPRWIADHGLEWAWRLALEPRRLATRYLVNGPPAYLAVRRSGRSVAIPITADAPTPGVPAANTSSMPAVAAPALAADTLWPAADASSMPGPAPYLGTIIIPAHNEESVIARTLSTLAPLAAAHLVDIIVVCNGCTDRTASIAAGFNSVRVQEISEPSKVAAMNTGDQAAVSWPRLYLDADIEAPPDAIIALFTQLAGGAALAGRPTFSYDTQGASWPVRSYYRARNRIPTTHLSLWGAGAYALTADGHRHLGSFPPLIADDLYVDSLFSPAEKVIIDTAPMLVRTPRNTGALLGVLSRQSQTNSQARSASTTGSSLRGLVRSTHGLTDAGDTAIYAAMAVLGRVSGRTRSAAIPWVRDLSSRPTLIDMPSEHPAGAGPRLGGIASTTPAIVSDPRES